MILAVAKYSKLNEFTSSEEHQELSVLFICIAEILRFYKTSQKNLSWSSVTVLRMLLL